MPSKDKSKTKNIVGVSVGLGAIFFISIALILETKAGKKWYENRNSKFNRNESPVWGIGQKELDPAELEFANSNFVTYEGKDKKNPFEITFDNALENEINSLDTSNYPNLLHKEGSLDGEPFVSEDYTPTLILSKDNKRYVLGFENDKQKNMLLHLVKSIRIQKIALWLQKNESERNKQLNAILNKKSASSILSDTNYLNVMLKKHSKESWKDSQKQRYIRFFENIIQNLWQQYWDKVVVTTIMNKDERNNILKNDTLSNPNNGIVNRKKWWEDQTVLQKSIENDICNNQRPLLDFITNIEDLIDPQSAYQQNRVILINTTDLSTTINTQYFMYGLARLIAKGPQEKAENNSHGILTHWIEQQKQAKEEN